MVRKALLLITVVLLLSGCGLSGPSVDVKSIKQVDTINVNQVYYKYEGKDNIEIKLDFKFDESLVADLDPNSDDFRRELFTRLVEGAHFYHNDQKVDRTWGYWPKEAGSNYAREMTLFYVVPSNRSATSLRFVYDGSILGEGVKDIDIAVNP